MRVLIISNNCFSKSQNMGKTLSSIFCTFNTSEVCQLYFYSSTPDISVCHDFYRISDYDLIQGKLFGKIGKVIDSSIDMTNKLYETEQIQKAYSSFNRDNSLVNLARTFLWDIARWNSPALDQWIRLMNPDCIFFASGDTVFSYKIVWKISQKYNLPIISYVCDEYYYGYHPSNILGYIYGNILKKWMKKIFQASRQFAVICNPLGELYQNEFKKEYYVLNTGNEIRFNRVKDTKQSNCLSYLGNIGLNRWKSLIQIGQVLDEYNQLYFQEYKLNIYSGETNSQILTSFGKVKSIQFMGKISPQECLEKMQSSIAVIHTESFDIYDIKRVKYSMSTKIADSLASGTCLFAYGSLELASIQYLYENQCAIVATSLVDLKSKLYDLLENEELRAKCIKKALILAKAKHDSQKNSIDFKNNILNKVVNNDESFTS